MKVVTVVDYDPEWPSLFEQLSDRIAKVVADSALAIEHVGSIDGKTDFIMKVLSVCGMTEPELESIAQANLRD